MMNMEILHEFTASNDQMIVKGKRTKRLRPSSSTSSSGGGGGGAVFNYNSSTTSSLTTSTSTQEDEDMANCLILLARGRGGFSPQSEDEIKPPESKFRSRKFTEMATTTNGKVGIYVYECKTCSRTFASFQALGGHRASHKKPKVAADADRAKSPPPREDEEEKFSKLNEITPATSTVLQLPKIEIKSKIHECSICGSEFSSGQALGGHMRRHRSAINGRSSTAGEDNCPSTTRDVGGEKSKNLLALDLNLPAPAEDDRREAEFHQYEQPRLVDCHY